MIVKNVYICETCGAEYQYEVTALHCESSPPLQPCPLSTGQKVKVYERYDDPQEDEVVGLELIYIGYLHQIEWNRTEEQVNKFLVGYSTKQSHGWLVEVKNTHQMSKDESSYTSKVRLSSIYIGDDCPYNDDGSKAKCSS